MDGEYSDKMKAIRFDSMLTRINPEDFEIEEGNGHRLIDGISPKISSI